MSKSKSQIMDEIQDFMSRHGPNCKDWYIGTASDPKSQMFKVHGFKNGDKGLFRQAGSEIQAAEIAEYFIGMGAKGHKGVARNAEFVYAYKRAPHTKP